MQRIINSLRSLELRIFNWGKMELEHILSDFHQAEKKLADLVTRKEKEAADLFTEAAITRNAANVATEAAEKARAVRANINTIINP